MRYQTRVVSTGDDPAIHTFECACGFTSEGWPLKKHAVARGAEHSAEHDSGEPARELVDFREDQGVINGPKVDVIGFDDTAVEG
ncbi:MAG: hypothetical protein JWP11_1905 [Frankiales bacterium]|nr:hypothetical protein [Frankiales bacterium]